MMRLEQHLREARWRLFVLKDGSELQVGKIPLDDVGWTWSIMFERSLKYKEKCFHDYDRRRDPAGGGPTLRAAFKKLRLRLALDQDPKLREVHKRVKQ